LPGDLDLSGAAELTRRHLESLFPKRCAKCGRVFADLREYLRDTRHVGSPVSYDAADGDWRPLRPVGTMSLANCACGSTLALGSEGMGLRTVWRLMAFARRETKRRGVPVAQVLEELRREVDRQVLSSPSAPPPPGEELDRGALRAVLPRMYLDAAIVLTPPLMIVWVAVRAAPVFSAPLPRIALAWSTLVMARLALPSRWLADVVPALFLLIAAVMLPAVGLSPGPWLMMASAAVLATAARGRAAGLAVAALAFATQLLVGAALSRGLLAPPTAAVVDPLRIQSWVRAGGFAMTSTVLIVVAFAALLARLRAALRAQQVALAGERRANEERLRAEREQRHAESIAKHAQQLEAIGRLAAGVAHDFKNHLQVIRSWGELLADERSVDEAERREGLADIRIAAARADELVRRLLAFAREQPGAPKPIDLDALLASMVGVLRRVVPRDVHVEHARAEVPLVLADEAALGQIVLNLALNAGDAMPGGGTLTLSTELLAPPGLPDDAPDPAATYVALRVRDTGVGMDEETRARVFEPFFTTKGPERGTGLGLSSVYGLAAQAHGFVTVESAPGAGATFTVALPVHEPARAESA
jgi:signal transduction histidine kinase